MKTLQWLIRREFWENKGGFFWAPIIAGIIFLLINVLGLIAAWAAAGRAKIQIGLIKLDSLINAAPPEAKMAAVAGIDLSFLLIVSLVTVVTAIVVFFYSLGSLYDDRKDRSILFWKSLPLSDRDTVLSKVISALLVAPVIGVGAGIATALGTLITLAIAMALHGQSVFGLLFAESHLLWMTFLVLATLPISIVWALPTIGWLMLCSSWARSKPFLWAVATPVGVGIMVNWFDLMKSFSEPDSWFWENVVARLLFGVAPGQWLAATPLVNISHIDRPQQFLEYINLSSLYSAFASPHMWIGAIAGIAMLVAATYVRRKRDDS